MPHWSRRDLLAGLGAGAAAGLLAGLGCGGRGRAANAAAAARIDGDDVRAWLRRAVEQLAAEFPTASAHAVIARRVTAAIDLRGRSVVRSQRAAVVLRVAPAAGPVIERAIGELSAPAIDRLVATLRRATTAGGARVRFGAPARYPAVGVIPESSDAAWVGRAAELGTRADAAGNSRVVYRGAWVDADDVTVWHVGAAGGAGFDREQHLARSRAGLVLMAWSGTTPMVGQVERGAVGGPDQIALADRDIAGAARGALELTTPGTVPAGVATVVLMPSVVAQLARIAIAPVLTTAGWGRPDLAARALAGTTVGAAAITIAAAPDPTRYGGYHFDDEGVVGATGALIEGGVLRGPVGDRRGAAAVAGAIAGGGVRPGHSGAVAPAIGHLAWAPAPGTADPDAVVADLDDAWIVDDAGAGHVDPVAWTVTIAVDRARRVKSGAETGHVHAGCELTASVPALLAAVTRMTSTVETFVARTGGDADARWSSVEVPAVVSRAMLAPRRAG